MSAHNLQKPFLAMIDISQHVPPMRYTSVQTRQMMRRLHQPDRVFVAYIHADNMIISIVAALLEALRTDTKRRFFHKDNEGDAWAWLRAEAAQ